MAHANIVKNEMVDDEFLPLKELSFAADQMNSKFSDQIQLLSSQRNNIPSGWSRIFDDAIRSLKAVDCPKRDGIEISEVAYGGGSLHLGVWAPEDFLSGESSSLTVKPAARRFCGFE